MSYCLEMGLVSHEEWSEESRQLVTSTFEIFRCDCLEERNPGDSRTRRGWTVCQVGWVSNALLQDHRKVYETLHEGLPVDTKSFFCCHKSAVNKVRCFALLGFPYRFESWVGVKERLLKIFSDAGEGMVLEGFYVCKQGEIVEEWIGHFHLFCDVALTGSEQFGEPFRWKDLTWDLVDEKLSTCGVFPTAGDMWRIMEQE